MLLPSKLVCHRDRLSQPALMSKIVFHYRPQGLTRKRDLPRRKKKKKKKMRPKKKTNIELFTKQRTACDTKKMDKDAFQELSQPRKTLQSTFFCYFRDPIHQIGCEMFSSSYHSHFDELGLWNESSFATRASTNSVHGKPIYCFLFFFISISLCVLLQDLPRILAAFFSPCKLARPFKSLNKLCSLRGKLENVANASC